MTTTTSKLMGDDSGREAGETTGKPGPSLVPTPGQAPSPATTTVNGASLRLNNGKLEYQCRCGNLLKWLVTFRDSYYDGWTGDTLWEPSLEAAREYVGLNAGSYRNLSRDPITPDYDSNPIAAGWSPFDQSLAKIHRPSV